MNLKQKIMAEYMNKHYQWQIQDFPEKRAPTRYDFVNFCWKLHENEEILAARGGAHPLRPP